MNFSHGIDRIQTWQHRPKIFAQTSKKLENTSEVISIKLRAEMSMCTQSLPF